RVPDWRTRPLADVVQAVQISADGAAYAQHEPEAQTLADVMSGATPAGITCSLGAPTKIAAPPRVAQLVGAALPIRTPPTTSNAVAVSGAHWQTAAWFVAYSFQLGIEQVSYDHKTWTRKHGWKASRATSAEVVATMYRS